MTGTEDQSYDIAVIGAGMAGMAAALFAAEKGLSCIRIGRAGGILFASGLLDLFAVHPVSAQRLWSSPYDALAALAAARPEHPLARIAPSLISVALEKFVTALGEAGLDYADLGRCNRQVLTSIGTTKTSYAIPSTMLAGALALERRCPCLLVDFRGLREFSAEQIVQSACDRWPGLRAKRMEFPGCEAATELHAAHLARALEEGEVLARIVEQVRPHLGDAQALGFPAVLGFTQCRLVHAALEAGLGLPIFEIPTMPTSVPGLRMLAALEAVLSKRGVVRRSQANVGALAFDADGAWAQLTLDSREGLRARAVVLASGRYTGRGLVADRSRVRERLLDLPVFQPETRANWHEQDFFDPAGHAINRAGLRVDDAWRPLDAAGSPAWPRLYAVGSILAHQDWMREKCGSGLAIATAWAATEQAARALRTGR